MISTLRGELQHSGPHFVVLGVNGVGFRVFIPERSAQVLRVGEEVLLHTTLVVREDELTLYGFSEAEERDTFDVLCGVNGVGPKSALGILNALSVEEIAHAISSDDDATFRQVSGIGPKTAKLITLTLQGKLHSSRPIPSTSPGDSRVSRGDEAAIVQALVGLGWSEKVAKKGVAEVMSNLAETDDTSVAALVKRALVTLGPQTLRDQPR